MTEHTGAVSLRERLKSPPATTLVDSYYGPGVAAGLRFQLEPELAIHLAHAVMLADRGIIAADVAGRIAQVVLALRDGGTDVLAIDYQLEDLYSYIERHIVAVLGPDAGGRLHTGRSRNDLHTTSWRMALRTRLLALLEALARLRATMLRLAAEHAGTVMPGYTHTQHAQPITFGYYMLSAADLLERDHRRLAAALATCDRSPLGAGALATTGFPIDREATADLLGFAGLVEVAYDGVSVRDDLQEAAAGLAVAMTGVSRVATDLQLWNTAEFGMVEFDDAYSAVSSIMPQKKNPVAMEHVKAVAAMATGSLAFVLACAKNTSLADVNDGVTAPNAPFLDVVERTTKALAVFDGALATLTVRPEAMLTAAAVGYGTATELADAIVRATGLSFRMAHNVVGRVVREAIAAGRPADAITASEIDDAATHLFDRPLGLSAEAVREALDPRANVESRAATGGPAPVRMAEMIARREATLAADRDAIAAVRRRLAAAAARLEASVAALIDGANGQRAATGGT